ncbi:N-succinylarginine dihydrolase [Parapedomonas caeni]
MSHDNDTRRHVEVNFDGLIGPTHNYAGLSLGNVASASNAGETSRPRQAALQGLAKMRALLALGLPQGFLPPHDRPNVAALRQLGFAGDDGAVCAAAFAADPALFRLLCSASPMWTANAATVSPAPDTADGRVHFSVANLATMAHRATEAEETAGWLRLAFADPRFFQVHDALPWGQHLADEGAANHMRLCPHHGAPGVEVFVYGEDVAGDQPGGRFPARQRRRASEAVARRHGLAPAQALFVAQSDTAIQAGAFHNDVVAVANERVLFAHEQAFADPGRLYTDLRAALPEAVIVEVPAARVSLADAIGSYLFNSQLVTLPDGTMALVLPRECEQNPRVWAYVQDLLGEATPIRRAIVIDVRESMRNGGGPACLRLRVALSPAALAAVDPRFLLDEARCDRLARVVEAQWPETIGPDDLANPDLWRQARAARQALLAAAGF